MSSNIQIAVKVRPFIKRELKEKIEPIWLVRENSIMHTDNSQNFPAEPYNFDHIFDQNTTNKQVYDAVVKPLVMSCLEGINSTIFAYGQTSSGKTHTMLGDKDVPGIIVYTVQDIFKHIEETTNKNFLLRCSYLEIYNEKINDLLDTKAQDLKIRESYDQMVYVRAREEVIRESNELFAIMKRGMKTRKIGCTDMNERSSRSHTIFRLVIQSQNKDSEGSYTESSLSLVDLAGSERVGQMNMTGDRQAEGVSINKSLTTLGLVIRKLSENDHFINYRDSKLTRLLQHSLGGNSRTLIICTITVAAADETKSTLEFAQRAKYVKNRPTINEKVTDKDQLQRYEQLCQDYKGQIERLRLEKIEREKTINSLEGKISNIQLFSFGNLDETIKVSKIPTRRHTLGHYKPFLTKSLAPMPDVCSQSDESSEDEEEEKPKPPRKSDVPYTISTEDDTEKINFNSNTITNTPSKTAKTQSPVLKVQTRLLEESYESLKTFTNYETQLLGQSDQIKELRELTDRLRIENIELRQQGMKDSQPHSNVVEKNKETFDQLILLRSILEGKSMEEIRRKSLHTITEEDFEMVSDQANSELETKDDVDSLKNEENKFIKSIDLKTQTNQTQDLQNENLHLSQQLSKYIIVEENLQASIDQILCKHQQEIKKLTDDLGTLSSQLKEKMLLLESQQTENDALNSQLKQYKEKITQIDSEKNRLKSELEDTIFQLNGEQKEVEYISQQLDQKSIIISDLEQIILHLKEQDSHSKVDEDKLQKFSDITTTLTKKENEIKTLEEKCKLLEQECRNTANKLSPLEEENRQLKKDLVMVQLKGGQQEAKIRQQLDKKSSSIEVLEKEISHLKETLEEKCKLLEQESSNKTNKLNLLEEENHGLKTDLECVMVQLKDGQQEFKKIIQQLDKKSSIIEVLEKEISHLKEKCKILEQESSYKTNKLSLLEEENYQLKTEHEDVMVQLKGVQQEGKQIRQQLDNKSSIIEVLEKEISHLKEKCKILEQESSYKTNKLSLLEEENHQLKTKHENVMVQLKGGRQEVKEIRHQLDKKSSIIEVLEKEMSHLKEKCKILEQESSDKTNKLSLLEEENHQLKTEHENVMVQLKGGQQEVKEIRHQLDKKSSIIEVLEKEMSHLKEKCKILEQESSYKTNKLSLLEEENHQLKTEHENEMVQLKGGQEVKEIRHQLDKKSSIIEVLEKEMSHLKEKCKILEQESSYKTNKLSLLEEENHQLKTEHKNVMVQLKGGQQEVKEIRQQFDNKSSIIEVLEKEISHLKEKCKILEQESSYKTNKLSLLEEENHQLKTEHENVMVQLKGGQQEVKKMRQQLDKKSSVLEVSEKELTHLKENQKQEELQACREYANALESRLKLEKNKFESLTIKLKQSESEIDTLQVTVNDLTRYKKKIQEKFLDGSLKEIPLSRLSDEGRPLSPNELRKIKRQSIHDQRRGLVADSCDSLELANIDCSDCKELKQELCTLEEQNNQLKTEQEHLKNENAFLDKENEDMLKIIKEFEQSETELHNQKEELEKEVLQNKELVAKYKNQIDDMEINYLETEYKHETVVKELRTKLDDYQCHLRKMRVEVKVEDKGTQATCDLNEKYKIVRKLAQIRRQEGNYLRAKLNMPPDCAVLPEDVQRQPTNV